MKTALSTHHLFHFTRGLNNLVSILEKGFYSRYYLEELPMKNKRNISMAFPMVCFCNISFNHQKDAVSHYGSYGIGLTMDWGIRNKLCPVIYTDRNSITTYTLGSIFDATLEVDKLEPDIKLKNINSALVIAASVLSCYYKPYYNNDKTRKFYDEREWRYVLFRPDVTDGNPDFFLKKDRYQDKVIRADANKELEREELSLKFNLSEDLEYIIVPGEEQRDILIQKLRSRSNRFTEEDLEKIVSKIYRCSEELCK